MPFFVSSGARIAKLALPDAIGRPFNFRGWHIADLAKCPLFGRYRRQRGHCADFVGGLSSDPSAGRVGADCLGGERVKAVAFLQSVRLLNRQLSLLVSHDVAYWHFPDLDRCPS
jgi:hypothetical protein